MNAESVCQLNELFYRVFNVKLTSILIIGEQIVTKKVSDVYHCL